MRIVFSGQERPRSCIHAESLRHPCLKCHEILERKSLPHQVEIRKLDTILDSRLSAIPSLDTSHKTRKGRKVNSDEYVERKCTECGWVGVSKEHAAGPCIPTLEDVADSHGHVSLPLGTKVDTPIGIGKVVALPDPTTAALWRPRVVQTRLYCAEKGCRRYLLGYFTAVDVGYFETKEGMCDLRNEEYWCPAHAEQRKTIQLED